MENTFKMNQAGRLINIITNAKKMDRTMGSKQAWARIFDIDKNDTSMIFQKLAHTMDLILQVKNELSSVLGADLYITPLEKVEKAFFEQNLNGYFHTFIDSIDATTIYGLNICAVRLAEKTSIILTEEEVLELLNTIASLKEEVYTSNLPKELIELIIIKLVEIQAAIDNYRMWGSNKLEQSLDSMIGGLLRNKDELVVNEKNPVLKKIIQFIGIFRNAVSTAVEVNELVESTSETIRQLIE
ncbi:hypothetical protein BBD42_06010 [Paenibacillus sp. BIHB 4019]|uniref:Uncharacterized protein n=1 Tax=Paenibacillus sp. BIHB 4019 TaxID=1870819 RepID=A0A1B2DEC0_9BACL|nr:hypothetical protein [Paenibacillus sp. BIHB 4019]ANY66061.1 hypothetical protein BBD42_06010 [Paenibacillus sp. BIHB 4019]